MQWHNLPNSPSKHGWAFFYYLKRRGDKPTVTKNKDGTINVTVRSR